MAATVWFTLLWWVWATAAQCTPGAGPHPAGAKPLPTNDVSRILGALISYLTTISEGREYIGLLCHQLDGDWCFNVPLWGNPVLLPNITVEAGRSRQERTGET